ncbi:MAG: winged helix-turn-helix transcriptional regulator [Betaproteobacteria bacterium]|nr:winged helix-turn-helix transcriptional regulator [Betaproteobacteria bacterium]
MKGVSERQQGLLQQLQRDKGGLTVDELAERLGITRTAVRQHLAALERDGYVSRETVRKAAGRPGNVYALTAAGDSLFPKQYNWFSGLLLKALREERGSEGLQKLLRSLADRVVSDLEAQLAGLSTPERIQMLARIMNDMGYDARVTSQTASRVEVVASNCVYHQLAAEFPEVCHFDYRLMERLTGAPAVEHPECMVRGGHVCHFILPVPSPAGKKRRG